MKEMIATFLLALGASSAHAQLGAVIPSSPAIPAARSASLKASISAPKKNLNQKDNLEGFKECQETEKNSHFDCVKEKLANLKKKNIFNSGASNREESHAYFPRVYGVFAAQSLPISRGKFPSNKILPAVKTPRFDVPPPLERPMLSNKRLSHRSWIDNEFASRWGQAKSYALKVPSYIRGLIDRYARKYSVDPNLALAMVKQESGGNRYAVSRTGAMGLGQLMPATARRFGVANPFDPRQNIAGMIRYLRFLKQKFNNDKVLMVAAYNSGEGRKSFRYGLIPRFHETIDYVKKVFGNYFRLTGEKVNYSGRVAPRNLSA